MDIITKEHFRIATGSKPVQDDLERANCPQAGSDGHRQCGWCTIHDGPMYICMCSSKRVTKSL